MFYYLYEVKNLLNGKIYIGVHKTKNMDDGYMGSGKVIYCAIKKHGIENFTKTILETFEDSKSMFSREREVVTNEFLARDDTYNLMRGGHGGFDLIHSRGIKSKLGTTASPETIRKLRAARSRQVITERTKQLIREAQLGVAKPGTAAGLRLHKKTDEHKMAIAAALVGNNHDTTTCPQCGLCGGVRAMKRYHFEKCKNVPLVHG